MQTHAARLFLLALLALLAGCGFALRGGTPVSAQFPALTVLAADPASPLLPELKRALAQDGVTVSDTAVDGQPVLTLSAESLGREILSYDERARVSEYLLRYQVEIGVKLGDAERLPVSPILLQREYGFDEQAALGAAQEEAVLTVELRREMVERILERLRRSQLAP